MSSLNGQCILIVEDQPIIAMDLEFAFGQAGATVSIASSLRDAMRLVELPTLAAAVVDFGLGESDARELLDRLNARSLPFILHSGHDNHSVAAKRGVVIPKPSDPQILIDAMSGLLKSRATGEALRTLGVAASPERMAEIQQCYDNGLAAVLADRHAANPDHIKAEYGRLLFCLAKDSRLTGDNLTLCAVHLARVDQAAA